MMDSNGNPVDYEDETEGKCVTKKWTKSEEKKWRLKKVPKCKSKNERLQCRCAKDHKSKCEKNKGDRDGDGKFGWCFLENMWADPMDGPDMKRPYSVYCYRDVLFSRRHGRFYSYMACDPKQKPSNKGPKEIGSSE